MIPLIWLAMVGGSLYFFGFITTAVWFLVYFCLMVIFSLLTDN